MSRPSEKARFYLEHSLPELRELEQKNIFSSDEISKILKKRSDFEHTLNARGVKPQDFIRYADWETNLESLRKTRVARLGVKNKVYHAGQRRIMFIMERATRRFPGDLVLWMRSVEVAQKQRSYKKISQILTSMLRLHPTNPEVWMFVVGYAANDVGDMAQARSYMQRGLRFCKNSQDLWLEFFKLELAYIAKLAARRSILGLDSKQPQSQEALANADTDDGFIGLPTVSAEEWEADPDASQAIDTKLATELQNTPALTGAIAMAIFDAAMDHFKQAAIAERYFEVCAATRNLKCARTVADHIQTRLVTTAPESATALIICAREALMGVDASSAGFPDALGVALSKLSDAMATHPSRELARLAIIWVSSYSEDNVDPDIFGVLSAVLSRLFKSHRDLSASEAVRSEAEHVKLLKKLQGGHFKELVPKLANDALRMWPSNDTLVELSGEVHAGG